MSSNSDSLPANGIAIVGMAGKFPGADSVSAFWDNLVRGEESIVTLSERELEAAGVDEKALDNPAYVRRASVINGIEEFDADFFGFPPQTARMLDPQHRLFLQTAWHALEDAGYDPAKFDGSIGVYGTSSPNGYLLQNLMSYLEPNGALSQGLTFEQFDLFLLNDKDFLTTRVSHLLNLRGPSIAVQTACSSSLVAVHLACSSLLSGECDMALAGGVSLKVPDKVGYWHAPGGLLSAVGHCRPFDVRSDGTVFGNGAGIVVLKPLQAAIDDGDRIHAVIRGSAINNDGSAKMAFSAPNSAAQADVIAEAHAVADVDASTISYVEAHGTGTPLGDPVEIAGLRTAFGVSQETRRGPCVIGSVKSNIGHLDVAAGVAGLIKTVLCLKNKAIPATLHYTSPNPELHLDESPFTVQNKYAEWAWDGARRAGVSSFGVGGTNAHVVLEEAPDEAAEVLAGTATASPQVLVLSARTAEALADARKALATALEGPDAPALSDVAHTLRRRRRHPQTAVAVVHDHAHAVTVLRAAEHENVALVESIEDSSGSAHDADRIVFLSPGQGAQHVGMAQGLYDTEPVFAEHFDACVAGFREEFDFDLKAEVFGGSATTLEAIDHAHPALFSVEYALGKLAAAYGVRAGAYAGHSMGEYVAATLAGVFDLETAIKVVSTRARLLHGSPAGSMAAVPLGAHDVARHLVPGVDIAVVNDQSSCVVAGPEESIKVFTKQLREHGVIARRVRVSHAAHSTSMDVVVPQFEEFLAGVKLSAPHTPLLSNVTGTWMTDEQATDPASWARQIRATVQFADEVDAMLSDPRRVLVEIGPGGSLTGSAMRHPKWGAGHRAVRLMRHPIQSSDDRDTFLLGLGQLWSAGVDVDWTQTSGARPHVVSLPVYPFARQRHWVEAQRTAWTGAPTAVAGVPAGSSNAPIAAVKEGSGTEEAVEAVWKQCMGLSSIDRNANFFELGGDSLIAINMMATSANFGLDINLQLLYENPTVASLAAAIDAEFARGGLANPPSAEADSTVTPAIAHFLEQGLREAGRWRVPMLLRLNPEVGVEDIKAVLTAVINHHDALRLQVVNRAGAWEQHIAPPREFDELATRTLPEGVAAGSPEERTAALNVLESYIAEQEGGTEHGNLAAPLVAVHITGGADGASHLALGVHGTVADQTARGILVADIFAAFAQQLAGEEIMLQPVTTSLREWSLRCAALPTHPAVLDTRDFWLENSGKPTLRLADPGVTQQPSVDDMTRVPGTLTSDQTAEVDDARRRLRRSVEEILIAALGRTIAATVGEGVAAVELEGAGRSVLRPDITLRRTVGWFTALYPVPLTCAKAEEGASLQVLGGVADMLKSVPHYGVGYGLLKYLHAPTARLLGAAPTPDIFFRYEGRIAELPQLDAPVQFDPDTALSVREQVAGLGHAIELRAYRHRGVLHVDWWYDSRRVQQATAEALAAGFPDALSELIQDAIAATDEAEQVEDAEAPALVDLSSM